MILTDYDTRDPVAELGEACRALVDGCSEAALNEGFFSETLDRFVRWFVSAVRAVRDALGRAVEWIVARYRALSARLAAMPAGGSAVSEAPAPTAGALAASPGWAGGSEEVTIWSAPGAGEGADALHRLLAAFSDLVRSLAAGRDDHAGRIFRAAEEVVRGVSSAVGERAAGSVDRAVQHRAALIRDAATRVASFFSGASKGACASLERFHFYKVKCLAEAAGLAVPELKDVAAGGG